MSHPDKKLVIPGEIAADTLGNLLYVRSTQTAVIYNTVVCTILIIIASLPIISLDVSIQSPGFVRPASEVSSIKSLASGRVKETLAFDNKQVHQGDTLYVIESEIIEEKEKYLLAKIHETTNFINDLQILINSESSLDSLLLRKPKTPLYQQALSSYRKNLNESLTHYAKLQRDYQRNKKLHNENVIADAEFENHAFAFTQAKHELEIIRENQLNQWQTDILKYKEDLLDYQSEYAQLLKEKNSLIIKAPVSGTIQGNSGIYPGSTIIANQDLTIISPDTSFIVEVYVSPNDIGLLQNNMSVKFQVDAFNYNHWGLAHGNVTALPNDIQIIDGKPVFRVKCSLDKDYLQLKNGYKGYFKKGMTLQARFIVAKRTLWQLLYDKVDNWMNPNISNTKI